MEHRDLHRKLGDLIQMLLIQVQKTKVDVDLAMAALDKLLKSNELNFAFLGNGRKICMRCLYCFTHRCTQLWHHPCS